MKLVALKTAEGAVAWYEALGRRKAITGWPSVDQGSVEGPDWGASSPGAWALGFAALLMATGGQEDVAAAWLPLFVDAVVARASGLRVEFEAEWVKEWMVETMLVSIERGKGLLDQFD